MDVWSVGGKKFQKKSSTGAVNFLQLVEEIFNQCGADEILQFSGTVRRVWLRRNEAVFEGTFVHPSILVQRTSTAVEEFAKANAVEDKLRARNVMAVEEVWRPPCHGWWKVNWDASLGKEQGWMGFGVVVRDDRGQLLAAYSKTLRGNLEVAQAEARAALIAIQFCRSLGLEHVHFEGDAKMVITAVNSSDPDWSSMGFVVEDIKHELQAMTQWCFTFVRREGNKAAHTMSKLDIRSFLDNTWLYEPPECISEILQMEQVAPIAIEFH
ncbi:uncharacterized protein LOC132174168 [Corylus avellana]|uniref:uncharacterized protein LOC132174168 n=1 Tax=Corylus avellana TaxID=13451 RepID=UPI00286D2E0B|nr:uncharacterized protein LOC132174168 [Corylus avellana]